MLLTATPELAVAAKKKHKCHCSCVKECQNNCANGFEENPIGEGLCILVCPDSCGCGENQCS